MLLTPCCSLPITYQSGSRTLLLTDHHGKADLSAVTDGDMTSLPRSVGGSQSFRKHILVHGMVRTCKHVHNKLSCTCLHNYTLVYRNMAAVTKFIAKNNKTTTSASKTMRHFGDLMHTKLHDRRIATKYPNPDS